MVLSALSQQSLGLGMISGGNVFAYAWDPNIFGFIAWDLTLPSTAVPGLNWLTYAEDRCVVSHVKSSCTRTTRNLLSGCCRVVLDTGVCGLGTCELEASTEIELEVVGPDIDGVTSSSVSRGAESPGQRSYLLLACFISN